MKDNWQLLQYINFNGEEKRLTLTCDNKFIKDHYSNIWRNKLYPKK